MKNKTIFILLILVLVVYVIVMKTRVIAPTVVENTQKVEKVATSTPVANLANPASENCVKVGGRVSIESKEDGTQYGLCYFEDNRACEEWALFRGECPVGGRKTTGYDRIDQKYCAWTGGNTYAVENSICTFKDGKSCSTTDWYSGTCDGAV